MILAVKKVVWGWVATKSSEFLEEKEYIAVRKSEKKKQKKTSVGVQKDWKWTKIRYWKGITAM